jgi:hypothetical protein
MYLARVLTAALGLASGLLLHAEVPSYFTTTAAGSVPPLANPIAAKQYFKEIVTNGINLSNPVTAVAYDGKGSLYYANGTQVWRLNADGTDTLIAGIPVPTQSSGDGGPTTLASLPEIFALSFDGAENLYIAHEDSTHYTAMVRKVTPDQNITTVATSPSFYLGLGMAVDAAGFRSGSNSRSRGHSGYALQRHVRRRNIACCKHPLCRSRALLRGLISTGFQGARYNHRRQPDPGDYRGRHTVTFPGVHRRAVVSWRA